jgi:hypothetical protein
MPEFHNDTLKLLKMKNAGLLPAPEKAPERGPSMVPVVGDIQTFWTYDNGIFVQTDAELVKITTEAYIYVQTIDTGGYTVLEGAGGTGPGYITQTDADDIAAEFTSIYSTNRSVFGNEPATGVDGDSHVTILLLDISSTYPDYKANGTQWWQFGWIAGYFFSIDTYTEAQAQGIGGHSNERKIIYIDTYPTIEHGSFNFGTFTMDPIPTTTHDNDVGGTWTNEGGDAAFDTVAHEFQHMIHFFQDPAEEVWVNEGCSGFAEFINGYGPSIGVSWFVDSPDDSLTHWGGQLTDYGNSFLAILYLYEQMGSLDSTITNLVKDSAIGTSGISNALGGSISYTQFMRNWFAANFLDDQSLGSEYGYTNIDMSTYSTGGVRPGIDPLAGSSAGGGPILVSPVAAKYYTINYNNLNTIDFTGDAFYPVGVGMNSLVPVSGSIQNINADTGTVLSEFGGSGPSSYQTLLLIAANLTGFSDTFSYSFSSSEGIYFVDNDGDGYGDSSDPGKLFASDPGAGYSSNNTDCDDTDPAINPGADEVCADGIDNDCKGGDVPVCIDSDGDGYHSDTDCDDTDPAINPGATEIPDDGIDNDCDGLYDNTFYKDADGDTYGDNNVMQIVTSRPVGYVLDNTDCDDTDETVYPGAPDTPGDGIDQDCSGADGPAGSGGGGGGGGGCFIASSSYDKSKPSLLDKLFIKLIRLTK